MLKWLTLPGNHNMSCRQIQQVCLESVFKCHQNQKFSGKGNKNILNILNKNRTKCN